MSLSDDILTILSNYSGGYRWMRAQMHQDDFWSKKPNLAKSSDNTVRVTLSRLKRKGFVQNNKGIWKLTKVGKTHLTRRMPFFRRTDKILPKNTKDLIIAFDISERERKKRYWLREELIRLGFAMLQKSVWFGPAPLPGEFIQSLRELGILANLKFFEAKESDVI